MKPSIVKIPKTKNQHGALLDSYLCAQHWLQMVKFIAQMARAVQMHRGASMGVLSGQPAFLDQARKRSDEVTRLFSLLNYLNDQGQSREFDNDLAVIEQEWDVIQTGWASDDLMDNFELHGNYIDHLLRVLRTTLKQRVFECLPDLLTPVSPGEPDQKLSPEFILALFDKIPKNSESIGQVRALSTNAAVRKAIAEENRSKIEFLLRQVNSEYQELRIVFSAVDEQYAMPRGYHKQFRVFVKGVRSSIVEASDIVIDSSLMFDISTTIINQLWDVVERGFREIERYSFLRYCEGG